MQYIYPSIFKYNYLRKKIMTYGRLREGRKERREKERKATTNV